MGYMGFGLQNWIFRQRPRPAFSKDRKPTGDTIPRLDTKEFSIAGRTQKNPEQIEQNKRYYLDSIRKRSIKEKIVSSIILITILLSVFLLYKHQPWKKYEVSNEDLILAQQRAEQQKKAVFEMTLSYGNRKLLGGEIESAIKEFEHALKIFPNSMEASEGVAKSYLLDCETNQNNCEKAKKLLDALIEKYPENYEYISYRFALE
ncbi:MAG: tetratricopeptide repeat protein [Bacteroidales bacterium]|nr:tetratricopeptide repeat protein [Bacteroidales bacterium]